MAHHGNLTIGDFVLDPSRNLLTGEAGAHAIEPKVIDVLVALAARPGTVISRDELIDAVWKAEFGADERLTRAISQLRKAFGDERDAPRYIETVSKRGYRLVAPVTAAPAEPDFKAEALPSVPHDTEAPYAAVTTPSRMVRLRPSWVLAAVAGVLLMTATVVAWRAAEYQAPTYARDLVALRPFTASDGSAETRRLALQTHAAVKRLLASNHLSVVERSASDSGSPSALEAEFELTATVERAAEKYAVTAFLTDKATAQTVWSHRFDRDGDDEGLQEEVGSNLAHVVGCALNDRTAARTDPSPQAFRIYLQACDLNFPGQNTLQGIALAQRLNAIAPHDAYGHGLAAIANAELSARPDLTAPEAAAYKAAARDAAARARALDPQSSHAALADAMAAPGAAYWHGIEAFLQRMKLTTPQPRPLVVHFLTGVGRMDEAVRAAEQRLAMAPLSTRELMFAAIAKMRAGDPVAADGLLARTLQLRPKHPTAHFYRFMNAAFYGDPSAAQALLDNVAAARDWNAAARACWQAVIGERARPERARRAKDVIDTCDAHAGGNDSLIQYAARIAVAFGDVDHAYRLVQGRSLKWQGATLFFFYPEMAPFRADPRFMAFIGPSGLPEYWTASRNWPDFCSKEKLPYDCKQAAAAVVKRKVSASQ